MHSLIHRARGVLLVTTLLACDGTPGGGRSAADAPTVERGATSHVPGKGQAALEESATLIVSFLSGDADFESLSLADTVELRRAAVGTAAAGAPTRVGRDALRDRYAWRVEVDGASTSIVPPTRVAKMTVRAGVHFGCPESPLRTGVPTLDGHPHVGVRLELPDARACTDAWRTTFVFDTLGSERPRLIGAVYEPSEP